MRRRSTTIHAENQSEFINRLIENEEEFYKNFEFPALACLSMQPNDKENLYEEYNLLSSKSTYHIEEISACGKKRKRPSIEGDSDIEAMEKSPSFRKKIYSKRKRRIPSIPISLSLSIIPRN